MGIQKNGGMAQANIINKRYKTEVQYSWGDMNDAKKNVRAGTEYLNWVAERPGDRDHNIKYKYGTGKTYPLDKIYACEKCLRKENRCGDPDYELCLLKVHK